MPDRDEYEEPRSWAEHRLLVLTALERLERRLDGHEQRFRDAENEAREALSEFTKDTEERLTKLESAKSIAVAIWSVLVGTVIFALRWLLERLGGFLG